MTILNVGDQAPDFTLAIGHNNELQLTNLQGSFVVLYFYPKDDTPGCTIEAKDFNSLKSEFETYGAVVVGVSKDDLKSHDKFKEKHCLEFALASDVDAEVCKKYGVLSEGSLFGVKYGKVNRATFLIDKAGKIAYIWPSVSVKGHAKAVLDMVKKLNKA